MPHNIGWLIVLQALAIQEGVAARILGVFIHPTRSNSQFTHSVMATLTAAGHDVTVYSPYKPPPHCGFHHVHVVTNYHKSGLSVDTLPYEQFVGNFSKGGFAGKVLRSISYSKIDSFFGHPIVQDLLKSNETFDLLITGAFFGEESSLVFGHKFKAPTISLLPMNTWSAIDYMAGNEVSLAIAPEYFAFDFSDRMSIIERIQNFLSGTVNLILNDWYDIPYHDTVLQRHCSWLSPPPPPVDQMVKDIAITFINVHPTIGYPKPVTPNFVLVGGIHIDAHSPPLTQNIQHFMDNSTEGVIFCSLGSIVPADSMPPRIIQAFIKSFRKFPQKVIWKISSKVLPSPSEKIIASSWLPQQRILEHPNLKLFFTHGGLGSTHEALRAGVPVVGLPFITDQHFNVRFLQSLGVGVRLDINTLSEETITTALETVLYNNSYAENARRMARLYADRPMEPADLVVYWTEYVLRHGGKHLRPQAALMPWYQRALLDVLAALLVGVAIVLTISIIIVKKTYQWIVCEPQRIKCKVK